MCQISMAGRVKATILYATETGRAAAFAQRVGKLFSHSFKEKASPRSVASIPVVVLRDTFSMAQTVKIY